MTSYLLTRLSTNVLRTVLIITYAHTKYISLSHFFTTSTYFAINFCHCAKTRTIDIAVMPEGEKFWGCQ